MNALHLTNQQALIQYKSPKRRLLAGLCAVSMLTGAMAQAETLRIAVVDIAPYAMTESDGRAFGQYPDLARRIAAQAEMETEIKVVSCERAAELLAAGQTDVVVSPDAAQLRNISQPVATIATLDTVVVGRAGQASASGSIGQLRGGCLDLATAGANKRSVALDSFHEGVRQLAARQIDGLAINREAFFHYANMNRLNESQWGVMQAAGQQMVWLYASKQLAGKTHQLLAQAVAQLKQDKAARDARTLSVAWVMPSK